jgi:hypothetical protein
MTNVGVFGLRYNIIAKTIHPITGFGSYNTKDNNIKNIPNGLFGTAEHIKIIMYNIGDTLTKLMGVAHGKNILYVCMCYIIQQNETTNIF